MPERRKERPVFREEEPVSNQQQTCQSEDFERPELLAFQEKTSRIQTVAQWGVALVVLSGIAGVFGGGGLSQASQSDPSGSLQVEFARFTRAEYPSELKLSFFELAPESGYVALWIGTEWLESLAVESIQPEPERIEIDDHRLIYYFSKSEMATSGSVVFRIRHQGFGRVSGVAGVVDGPSLAFDQFAYP